MPFFDNGMISVLLLLIIRGDFFWLFAFIKNIFSCEVIPNKTDKSFKEER